MKKLDKTQTLLLSSLYLFLALLLGGSLFGARAAAQTTAVDYETNRAAYLEFVRGSLESGFMDEWRGRRPMQTMEDVNRYLNTFNLWAMACQDARYFNLNAAETKMLQTFRQTAAAIQTEAFPRLRDAFGPILRSQITQKDVSGRTIGQGCRIADFYGPPFSDAANIRNFHGQVKAVLIKLRFAQADYRLTAKGPAVQAITVSNFADDDMVVWLDGLKYQLVK